MRNYWRTKQIHKRALEIQDTAYVDVGIKWCGPIQTWMYWKQWQICRRQVNCWSDFWNHSFSKAKTTQPSLWLGLRPMLTTLRKAVVSGAAQEGTTVAGVEGDTKHNASKVPCAGKWYCNARAAEHVVLDVQEWGKSCIHCTDQNGDRGADLCRGGQHWKHMSKWGDGKSHWLNEAPYHVLCMFWQPMHVFDCRTLQRWCVQANQRYFTYMESIASFVVWHSDPYRKVRKPLSDTFSGTCILWVWFKGIFHTCCTFYMTLYWWQGLELNSRWEQCGFFCRSI